MRHLEAQGPHKLVLGMIHLAPLPGTPFYEPGSLQQTIRVAVASAQALQEGGADGCLIQTVDRVYTVNEDSDPARTAAMTLVVQAVAEATGPDFHVGVQLMTNALMASLAVAKIAGGTYIRASALVGATLNSQGIVHANPQQVMEYRTRIAASDIAIIAEVDSMHFHWLDGRKTTAEVASAARSVGADAVSVAHRDEDTVLAMIAAVRAATPDLPIILAGYTNHDNASRLLAAADGAFVGTCLEAGGWGGRIDAERVRAYTKIVRALQA